MALNGHGDLRLAVDSDDPTVAVAAVEGIRILSDGVWERSQSFRKCCLQSLRAVETDTLTYLKEERSRVCNAEQMKFPDSGKSRIPGIPGFREFPDSGMSRPFRRDVYLH